MSIILLGIGYVLAFYFHEFVKFVKRPMEDPVYVPVIILIAIVLGTYFLFSSYTVIVLKKMRSKKTYFIMV